MGLKEEPGLVVRSREEEGGLGIINPELEGGLPVDEEGRCLIKNSKFKIRLENDSTFVFVDSIFQTKPKMATPRGPPLGFSKKKQMPQGTKKNLKKVENQNKGLKIEKPISKKKGLVQKAPKREGAIRDQKKLQETIQQGRKGNLEMILAQKVLRDKGRLKLLPMPENDSNKKKKKK